MIKKINLPHNDCLSFQLFTKCDDSLDINIQQHHIDLILHKLLNLFTKKLYVKISSIQVEYFLMMPLNDMAKMNILKYFSA